MAVEIRGLGQPDDSQITKSAAWLVTASALLSEDARLTPYFSDPYASRFAKAIAPEASAELAALGERGARNGFLAAYEAERSGCVGVVLYRKPWFERHVRAAIDQGAGQLVILGAGCDTLTLRLAASGRRPDVYELDRPGVTAFREVVHQGIDVDLSHVRRLGVDFEFEDFRQALIQRGFRTAEPSAFIAEGVIEYLAPNDVDVIFDFVRDGAGPGSTMVFSFTEPTDGRRYITTADGQALPGEVRKFELDPADASQFLDARGFELQELWTARDIRDGLMADVNAHLSDLRLGVVPFMHFAVARVKG
jgi:methyltransferase (TIGR00027 family)